VVDRYAVTDRVVDRYAVTMRPVNGTLSLSLSLSLNAQRRVATLSSGPVTNQYLLLKPRTLHFEAVQYSFSIDIRHQAAMQIPENVTAFWTLSIIRNSKYQ
jgi:hypothetical protein